MGEKAEEKNYKKTTRKLHLSPLAEEISGVEVIHVELSEVT